MEQLIIFIIAFLNDWHELVVGYFYKNGYSPHQFGLVWLILLVIIVITLIDSAINL